MSVGSIKSYLVTNTFLFMLMLYIQVNNFLVMFGLKQYKAEEKVFCSRTQLKASDEFQTVDPLISSPVIYH